MFNRGNKDLDGESKNTGKSWITAYVLLIGLSCLAAFIVGLPWLWIGLVIKPSGYDLSGLGYIMPVIFEWWLILPATITTFFIFKKITREKGLHQINWVIQSSIPLVCIFIAANGYIFLLYMQKVTNDMARADERQLSQHLKFSITDTKLQPAFSMYDNTIYQVNLHVQNNSGHEISEIRFAMIDSSGSHTLGWYLNRRAISAGSSDILIDLPIGGRQFCTNENIKEFYLVYTLPKAGDEYGHILIDEHTSQRLRELIKCD